MKFGLPFGLSDPVAEVEADGLDETTLRGRRQGSSQEKAPKKVKERSHIHNMHS